MLNMQMPQYQCHKKVWALQILEVIPKQITNESLQIGATSLGALLIVEEPYAPIKVDSEYMTKHKPVAGGYYVIYEDGYKSFSPKLAFEEGYSLESIEPGNTVKVEVFKVVVDERTYQDRKWGPIEKRPREVGTYLTLMRKLLGDAETAYAENSGDILALDELRKVVAVGFACFEQHGVPSRAYNEPEINEANGS